MVICEPVSLLTAYYPNVTMYGRIIHTVGSPVCAFSAEGCLLSCCIISPASIVEAGLFVF